MEGIRRALSDALNDDPSVVFAGIDVAAGGGVFAVSRGLHTRFPDRVLDTEAQRDRGSAGELTGIDPSMLRPARLQMRQEIADVLVSDRDAHDLHRCEPRWECSGVVLDQDAHEALDRAEQGPVDHVRLLA